MKEQIDLSNEDIHLDDQLEVWSFRHYERSGSDRSWPYRMQNTMKKQNGEYADRWPVTLV